MTQRIAIVGGGIAGLVAAHHLREKYELRLFERQARLGGNAYTWHTRDGHSLDVAVAAFGRAGYPQFFRLLRQLGVRTARAGSFMSCIDMDSKDGIYITPSVEGLKAQRLDVLRPSHLTSMGRLAWALIRSRRLLDRGRLDGLTVAQALELLPEIRDEARVMFLCTVCMISSMTGEQVLSAPARFFFDKLRIHDDVLSPRALYSIRCVEGGTVAYVNALADGFRRDIVLDARVVRVSRAPGGVTLHFADGHAESFARVVFACNPDQALALLEDPDPLERRLLGAWRYNEGRIVLHRDHSHFPPRPLMQGYTFLYKNNGGGFSTSVNGGLWFEPNAGPGCDYVSTQHPNFPIRSDLVEHETVLRTPVFDFRACAAIPELPKLNGIRNSYYCGSYFGHGLHEDAVTSAMEVARHLGALER